MTSSMNYLVGAKREKKIYNLHYVRIQLGVKERVVPTAQVKSWPH